MGCCFSKEDEEPDEQTPLLDGGNTYKPTKFPRYDRFKEEELLQGIVQRTAENLIDISNTHATERLQPPDFIDRTNDVKEIISTIKLDSKALQKIQADNTLTKLQNRTSSSQQTRPPHLVLKDGGVTKDDKEWLFNAMNKINEALDSIEVEYVGDLVVPLTWANSAPFLPVH